MQPTTYRGDAIIDGESIDAELRLDRSHLRLAISDGTEVLAWPLSVLDVLEESEGTYRLTLGEESFGFVPVFDDGLDAEIETRRRLAIERIAPPAPSIAPSVPAVRRSRTSTGRPHRRGVLDGRDLRLRTAVGVLALLAALVVAVAALTDRTPPPTTIVLAGEETPATSVAEPVPTSPTETVPPTVAGVTITAPPATAPPPPPEPVVPGVNSEGAFAGTPAELVDLWNRIAANVPAGLPASDLEIADASFRFASGDFVTVIGEVGPDGRIAGFELRGDPSGSTADDRHVLASFGIALATVDPAWSVELRREILARLGLDVQRPQLDGLDGRLVFEGKDLSLRWDGELQLIVLAAAPVGSE